MDFIIFGAQGIALGACQAFRDLYPRRKARCFLVSRMEGNPSVLEGLAVLELAAFAETLSQEEKDNTEILIATPEPVMGDIEAALEYHGFRHYSRLTSSRWALLMGYHYVRGKKYIPLSVLPVGGRQADIHLFMARFYRDRPLAREYAVPEWVTPIQAGASLCGERIADILDCDGENISAKNGNYSELTVLYWIWKNRLAKNRQVSVRKPEYYGLCHYRRILELSEDDRLRLENNEVDVVLPYPMPYEPNIEEHHKRYLADADWQALLTALEEIHPRYAKAFPAILRQRYLYNYNIILARREVLADYCGWLFPVPERTEQLSEPKGWERNDRYIGYMGETLETLYFMRNWDKLHITHAGCRFLV